MISMTTITKHEEQRKLQKMRDNRTATDTTLRMPENCPNNGVHPRGSVSKPQDIAKYPAALHPILDDVILIPWMACMINSNAAIALMAGQRLVRRWGLADLVLSDVKHSYDRAVQELIDLYKDSTHLIDSDQNIDRYRDSAMRQTLERILAVGIYPWFHDRANLKNCAPTATKFFDRALAKSA